MRAPLPQMTHLERVARAHQKAQILLKFLGSGEVYTTSEVAADLLQIDRSRAAACMNSLEKQGALKSETHDVRARFIKAWGITPHGLAMVDAYGNPFVELGRTNGMQLEHRAASQKMRIKAEAAGWTNWTPERIVRLTPGLKKIPDAVSTNPAGSRIAIEIERHCKTPKRYAETIVSYLLEIKAGRYDEVHFVCPAGVERLIYNAFNKIKAVKFNGETVKLEEKHRARFKFYSFDQWPESEAKNG